MTDYTKDQEREALEAVGDGLSGRKLPIDLDAVRVVFAMAKRTAEAEEAFARLIADRDYVRSVVTYQRDALKARVAELEARLSEADNDRDALRDTLVTVTSERDEAFRSPFGPSVEPVEAARGIAEIQRAVASSPTVALTRELLEMMLADAETRAVYGRGDVPLNPAARLVVALRKMLEVKP